MYYISTIFMEENYKHPRCHYRGKSKDYNIEEIKFFNQKHSQVVKMIRKVSWLKPERTKKNNM